MDPNVALALIFSTAAEPGPEGKRRFIEACQTLLDWLSAGGFAPRIPAGKRWIPGTGTRYALLCPVAGVSAVWELVEYDLRGERLRAFVLPAEARRICAWCQTDLGPASRPDGGATHGICEPCLIKSFPNTRRANVVQEG